MASSSSSSSSSSSASSNPTWRDALHARVQEELFDGKRAKSKKKISPFLLPLDMDTESAAEGTSEQTQPSASSAATSASASVALVPAMTIPAMTIPAKERGSFAGFDRGTLRPIAKRARGDQRRKKRTLLQELLADLDEVENIPFFDILLPTEVVLTIFGHLSMPELCQCSMVSKAWHQLANDNTLWYRHATSLSFVDPLTSDLSDEPSWKAFVGGCVSDELALRRRWREQKAVFTRLHHSSIQCKSLHGIKRFGDDLLCIYGAYSALVRTLDNGEDDLGSMPPRLLGPVPPDAHIEGKLSILSAMNEDLVVMGSMKGVVNIWERAGMSFDAHLSIPLNADAYCNSIALPPSGQKMLLSCQTDTGFGNLDYQMPSDSVVCLERSDDGEWRQVWQKSPVLPAGEARRCHIMNHNHNPSPSIYALDCNTFAKRTPASITLWSMASCELLHSVLPYTPGVCCTSSLSIYPGPKLPGAGRRTGPPAKLFFTTSRLSSHELQCFDMGSLTQTSMPVASTGRHIDYGGAGEDIITLAGETGVHIYDLRSQQRLEASRLTGREVTCIQSDEWKFVAGVVQHRGRNHGIEVWDWRMDKRCLWQMPLRARVDFLRFRGPLLYFGSLVRPSYLSTENAYGGELNVLDFQGTESDMLDPANPFSSAYEDPLAYATTSLLETPYENISNPYGLG